MRTRSVLRTVFSSASVGVLSLATQPVWAQLDTNPPLPNVLLLVDTSGSMEYLIAPDSTGAPVKPTCTPTTLNTGAARSRWTELVAVLTGEIQNYSCEEEPRASADYTAEYQLGGKNPIDSTYYMPHYRITSNGCQVGPNPTAWPEPSTGNVFPFTQTAHCKPTDAYSTCKSPFREHKWDNASIACTTGFTQNEDGLLDAFKDRARFGLMTFDPDPGAGTGKVSTNGLDPAHPFDGMWSYYDGWGSNGGSYAWGRPGGCATPTTMEVGVRNPAAPPWEGRLIPFGDVTAAQADNYAQNARIQDALIALRPYGATPTNGMFSDAEFFLTMDTTADPQDPSNNTKHLGPSLDPLVAGKCRDDFVILLTDGEPNLDMRPECTSSTSDPTTTGHCPYPDTSDVIVTRLKQKGIKTFVVGFAVSTASGGAVQCDQLNSSTQYDVGGKCTTASIAAHPDLKPCCELAKIAFAGGTQNPQFADSQDKLRAALNDILSKIAQHSTSRTAPAFASAAVGSNSGTPSNSQAPASSYQFLSSFIVSSGGLWSGILERERYVCESSSGVLSPVLKPVDPSKGDRFSDNLNSSNASTRYIASFIPTTSTDQLLGTRTIRKTTANDGLGTRTGAAKTGDPATFTSLIPPESVQVLAGATTTSTCSAGTTLVTAAACRDRILKWDLGLPPASGITYTRVGNMFGSIYHSTPTIAGPPTDFVRDETYTTYGSLAGIKDRPLVMYTATTDGQLHAFKVAATTSTDTNQVDSLTNNELWSFIPPAVLPGIRTLYPGVQKNLLDGAPVVKDVVFSRTKNQAAFDPSSTSAGWNTVLVAGFGPSLGGYYALDVTKPVPSATTGPQFLWQLTTAEDATTVKPLFGTTSTSPAVTTIFYNDGSGSREIAVAILPGGDGDSITGTCTRDAAAGASVDADYQPRAGIRCYNAADPALSLTIVRIDTGEVIRTFRTTAGKAALPADLQTRTLLAKIDSPIVGTPAPYPIGTGVLSNRVFVGDRDGGMWRLDLSSPTPSDWTMKFFFDGFTAKDFPTASATSGQPVRTPPVLSVDSVGNVVVLFSTGDQDQIAATTGMQNVVWSVSEAPDLATQTLKSKANWHLGLNESYPTGSPTGVTTQWNAGERVTGPMTLFNGTLYFASFRPQTTDQLTCTGGGSTLWAVDFLERTDVTSRSAPPKGRLILDPTGTLPVAPPPAVTLGDSVVFGVGLARTPPCFTETSYFDAYFGASSSSGLSDVNPGQFQLVVQTGSSGTATSGSQTNSKTYKLPTQPASVRIDSWASVVE